MRHHALLRSVLDLCTYKKCRDGLRSAGFVGRKRNPMTVYLFVCLAEGCAWCFISAGEGRDGVQAFTFCVPVITPDEAPEEPHALPEVLLICALTETLSVAPRAKGLIRVREDIRT